MYSKKKYTLVVFVPLVSIVQPIMSGWEKKNGAKDPTQKYIEMNALSSKGAQVNVNGTILNWRWRNLSMFALTSLFKRGLWVLLTKILNVLWSFHKVPQSLFLCKVKGGKAINKPWAKFHNRMFPQLHMRGCNNTNFNHLIKVKMTNNVGGPIMLLLCGFQKIYVHTKEKWSYIWIRPLNKNIKVYIQEHNVVRICKTLVCVDLPNTFHQEFL